MKKNFLNFAGKGCLSRYMLLKEFNTATGSLNTSSYADNLINGINFATRSIKAHIPIQGEGILELVYNNECGFSAGLDYNIYGHYREKGCKAGASCNPTLDNRFFGFKGCSPVQTAGLTVANAGANTCAAVTSATPVPFAGRFSSTESNATISSCGDLDNSEPIPLTCVGGDGGVFYINTCANNITALVGGGTEISTLTNGTVSSSNPPIVVSATGVPSGYTSAPVIINPMDPGVFNIQSGLAGAQITNKIFGHLDYKWSYCEWSPAVYFG